MTASYVSARFEKTDLSASLGKQRCVVRNLYDGPVPPLPSGSYYPTQPASLRDFLVIEYVNDIVGERLVRIATLSDFITYAPQQLTIFEDLTMNFIAAGVNAGDVIEVYLGTSGEWSSEEYVPVPQRFTVASIIDATHVTVLTPLPSFKTTLNWGIPAKGIAKAGTGTTRRSGSPAPLTRFLDRRMNLLFDTVPDLDAFVAAAKASLDALAKASTSTTLSSESYTSQV